MKTKISILGCGWLGLDLAKDLLNADYGVKGSTTTQTKLQTLKNCGIEPFLIELTEKGIKGDIEGLLLQCDVLIIVIPPGLRKRPNKRHDREMAFVAEAISYSSVKHILFIGSTSVFKDDYNFPRISHNAIPNNTSTAAQQLIAVEQTLNAIKGVTTTILRFSGLIGSDRHPAYYLQGRNNLANPEGPINLIHKTDCLGIIEKIVMDEHWGETFNASFPKHPTRKAYYTQFCKLNDLAKPTFMMDVKSKGKIIDSTKMAELLEYNFRIEP